MTAIESEKVKDDVKFPWGPMLAICLGTTAHSVVYTYPLPFVAFMVVDFGMAKNLEQAGYSAGYITGMFMVGRIISSLPWGMVSDRWGRKPCMLISMFSILVFALLFGFSHTFFFAMAMRLSIGLGNSFSAISKTYITEMCSCKEHEVRAFGYLNGVWGLSMIVGPVIGGVLARPAIQYPHVFSQDGLWGRYPYLLPSAVSSCIAAVAALTIFLFAPETLNRSQAPSTASIKYAAVEQDEAIDEEMPGGIEMTKTADDHLPHSSVHNAAHFEVIEEQDSSDDLSDTGSLGFADDHDNGEIIDFESSASSKKISKSKKELETPKRILPTTFKQMISDPYILILVFEWMVLCMVTLVVDETFPLWCVTSYSSGGLSWESAEVGAVMAASGLTMVVFQLSVFNWFNKAFFDCEPAVQFYRWLVLAAFTVLLLPFTIQLLCNWLGGKKAMETYLLKLAITLFMAWYRICVTSAGTPNSMMINHSIDQSLRGTINGVLMLAGSFGNGIGPVIGAAMYAFAIEKAYGDDSDTGGNDNKQPLQLPFDGRIVFLFAAVVAISLGYLSKVTKDWDKVQQ